jgi:transcription initiation factor TFIID subunit 2
VTTLMQSLCNALLGKVETLSGDLEFDMESALESQAEEQIEKDSISEIDRYRRMDEWSSSFQNIYSRTALRCQLRFMRAKMVNFDLMHFLQYTRAGGYDLLRLEAFNSLIELDIFRTPELLRWVFYTMSSDNSALIRHKLHQLFGRALASIAFGDGRNPEPAAQDGGLIIEQESSTEVRRADLARRQTVPGALNALKRELSGNLTLRESIWAACNSTCVSLLEVSDFVDLCRVLYDSVCSVMVTLKYPRYWKVEHLGNVYLPISLYYRSVAID